LTDDQQTTNDNLDVGEKILKLVVERVHFVCPAGPLGSQVLLYCRNFRTYSAVFPAVDYCISLLTDDQQTTNDNDNQSNKQYAIKLTHQG
jgi:hypothetical protein